MLRARKGAAGPPAQPRHILDWIAALSHSKWALMQPALTQFYHSEKRIIFLLSFASTLASFFIGNCWFCLVRLGGFCCCCCLGDLSFCVCVSVYVCVRACICMCVGCVCVCCVCMLGWRPNANSGYLCYYLERRSPRTQSSSVHPGWTMSFKEPLVCEGPVLGLQELPITPGFHVGSRIHTRLLLLAQHRRLTN